MADFSWEDRQVSVSQANNCLCRVDRSSLALPLSFWGNFKISGNVFGGLERDILAFRGDVTARLKWTPLSLHIPPASPFASLDLGNPFLSVGFDRLQLTANSPSIVGQARSMLSNTAKTVS